MSTDPADRPTTAALPATVDCMSTAPAADAQPIPATVPVTHILRRAHDGTLISAHGSRACAQAALGQVSLAAMMGENPPGPLEWVTTHLVDVATGTVLEFTGGLVPLDGIAPPEVDSWP